MKPSELAALLSKTIPAGLPVLITGAPGIGKTDIVRQACAATKRRILVGHPVVSDPTDFKGLPFPSKDQESARFLPFGDLAELINAKEPTVYLLDDIGQAPPSVQAACMQLLLARSINGKHVSDQVCFLAATNRRTDRAGVQGILEPVKSRFATIVTLEADLNDWCKWATAAKVPIEMIGFLRFRPNLLHDFKPTPDMTNGPCPRTWHNAAKLMKAGIMEYEAMSGAVGEGAAAEFLGFIKIFRELPNPEKIEADPESAPVPTNAATLYAICAALAHRANNNNIAALVRYFNRLPDEFSVMAMRDALAKTPTILI